MVDWTVARATAARTSRPGPAVSLPDAREVVASLRMLAASARGPVAELTGLDAPAVDAPAAVVDRAGWVDANATGFQAVVEPLVARLRARRGDGSESVTADGRSSGDSRSTVGGGSAGSGRSGADGRSAGNGRSAVDSVGSRVTGMQVGAMLGFLSARVLGQYELFTAPGERPRLLLVAPNLVAAERAMDVDPHDFRLWVCLHEETHRVQFTAVPWLGDHLRDEVRVLVEASDLDPSSLRARLGPLADALRAAARGTDGPAVVDVVTTPRQRVVLERLTAVMSLLEGHADHVMDAVGPSVVPSVVQIRRAFEQRRSGGSRQEQLLRRLLGLDAKLAQYRDGAAFVRGVVDRVGMEGFNAVWTSAETLPQPGEIADPAAWVRRVHG